VCEPAERAAAVFETSGSTDPGGGDGTIIRICGCMTHRCGPTSPISLCPTAPIAPDLRQLRHPQACRRAGLAGQTSPVPPALHPHVLLWLILVERWFRELTDKALRRGVFHSVPDLITKIEHYLTAHNNNPKPFLWTATADDILAKVARGRVALQAVNQ